uniref:CAZy families PL1 protein n=1 Tax=uncultured Flavobacterium sp. TaxID=165435 RepID=A0A060CHE7_9FLAO|nr:CAZy families PL1 protein [uncultured Flavobacterium sp.]
MDISPREVTNGGPDTLSTSKAKFIISSGNPGRNLTASWYKAGVVGPEKARFSDDGLTIDDQKDSIEASPEAIELRIRGLNPGAHTLITYHNIIDQVDAGTQAAVDIL